MSNALNIIIAEDSALLALSYTAFLTSEGHKVILKASKGADLTSSSQISEADLFLLDINLADDISGIDAAIEIRKTNNTPIIFVTGSLPIYEDEIRAIDNCTVISKPFQFHLLRDEIQVMIKKTL